MPTTVFGLPVHPLVVHATVVIVPLAALSVLLAAVWPRFRSWAGPLPFVLAVVGLILTPISTSSGESLVRTLGPSKAVEEHSQLADLLVWVMIPLVLLAGAAWWLRRKGTTGAAVTAVSILGGLVGIGALVLVVMIGHTGATAAWCGQSPEFSKCPTGQVAPSGD